MFLGELFLCRWNHEVCPEIGKIRPSWSFYRWLWVLAYCPVVQILTATTVNLAIRTTPIRILNSHNMAFLGHFNPVAFILLQALQPR
jgi:hypothetical protein